jgi:predicted RNase H-like HicB family nuclease
VRRELQLKYFLRAWDYDEETSLMELTARIHIEDGSYWADVPELPGCFASGDTLDELFQSLQEGAALVDADASALIVAQLFDCLPRGC